MLLDLFCGEIFGIDEWGMDVQSFYSSNELLGNDLNDLGDRRKKGLYYNEVWGQREIYRYQVFRKCLKEVCLEN